eukprot:6466854-Amphidinium_carterae.1
MSDHTNQAIPEPSSLEAPGQGHDTAPAVGEQPVSDMPTPGEEASAHAAEPLVTDLSSQMHSPQQAVPPSTLQYYDLPDFDAIDREEANDADLHEEHLQPGGEPPSQPPHEASTLQTPPEIEGGVEQPAGAEPGLHPTEPATLLTAAPADNLEDTARLSVAEASGAAEPAARDTTSVPP